MIEKKQIDFDEFADKYRETHTNNVKAVSGKDSYYFSMFKVKELARFEKNGPLKLLDLGCGDGTSEIYFQQYFNEFILTGADVSEQSIRRAQSKKIINSNFIVYDGITLPVKDASFDIVFIACVLHHLTLHNQELLILEAVRVLKRGGRLYIFEHNPYNPVTRYLVSTCEFDEGVKLLMPFRLKKKVKESGMSVSDLNYILFFPRHKLFRPLLFLEKYLKRFFLGGQYYIRCIKD